MTNILTSFIVGRAMAGPDLSGHEAEHRGEIAAANAKHRASMVEREAEQQVEVVVGYASNQRMKRLALRRAADSLIEDLKKANLQHPLISKEAFNERADAELDKEFAKSDEQIRNETLQDMKK